MFHIIKTTERKAKLDPISSPHWFRHTSSEHAFKNGAPLKEIQENLGQSSLSTTQVYLGGRSENSNSDLKLLPSSRHVFKLVLWP